MADTLLDDEQTQPVDPDELARRQRSVGKIIGPPESQAQKATITPIGKPLPPAGVTPGPETAPPEMPAPSAPSSIGTPVTGINTPAIGIGNSEPNQPKPYTHSTDPNERLQALQEQGPPQYHGLKRIADTIAGSTNIGSLIEQAGGLGTEGYERKLHNAEAASGAENKQTAEGQEEKQRQATLEGTKAKTEQMGDVTVTLSDGRTVTVPKGQEAGLLGKEVTQQGETERSNTKLGLDAEGKPIPEEQLPPAQREQIVLSRARENLANAEAEYARFRSDPKSPMYNIAQQKLKIAMDEYGIRQREFGYNYEPSILTPEEQNTLPTDVAGNPVALHSPLKPGQQTINAAQRAQNVVTQVPRLKQEITRLQDQLGPGIGRWNDFWQGKVGAPNPEFATIKDDMEYLSSAVALAHAYGRLPTSISDKFDQMYNAGKQDPANMQAALDVAMEWMPKITQGAKTVGERKAGETGGQEGAATAPHGLKITRDDNGRIVGVE